MQTPSSSPRELTQVLVLVRWLLILLFVVLGWVVLAYLAHVLAPILAALGIAYLLNPVVEWLRERGLSRTLATGLVLVSFIAVIVVGISLAVPAIAEQVSDFAADLPSFVANLSGWAEERFGVEIPRDWTQYLSSEEAKSALGEASGPLRHLAAVALGGIFSVIAVLAEMLLVPVFAFYFLADWPNLWRRLDHVIPPRRRETVRELVRQIDSVVSNWVRGQAIVTSTLAILYAICFTAVGMPLSVPIGLLVGALTVIPFVGTVVGAGIAALVTLGAGAGVETLALVGGVILVLHLLEAAVLTPKIVGHRVGLGEASALLAVVAGGKLLGFVGVVLAVPIAATFAVLVRVAIRYYETTAFFGHESDADVEVTPAMALIMPAWPWTWTGTGFGEPAARGVMEAIEREVGAEAAAAEGQPELELGPAGAPRTSQAAPPPPAAPADDHEH
ncbi:MAG TPA: AI-2E family transporter [Kofleriaceae bacterium]|nr:AI-2E family transporter [Kofleriaceae bacterium]